MRRPGCRRHLRWRSQRLRPAGSPGRRGSCGVPFLGRRHRDVRPLIPSLYTLTLVAGGGAPQLNAIAPPARGPRSQPTPTAAPSRSVGWPMTRALCTPPSYDAQIARDAQVRPARTEACGRLDPEPMADGGTCAGRAPPHRSPSEGARRQTTAATTPWHRGVTGPWPPRPAPAARDVGVPRLPNARPRRAVVYWPLGQWRRGSPAQQRRRGRQQHAEGDALGGGRHRGQVRERRRDADVAVARVVADGIRRAGRRQLDPGRPWPAAPPLRAAVQHVEADEVAALGGRSTRRRRCRRDARWKASATAANFGATIARWRSISASSPAGVAQVRARGAAG